VDAAYVSLDGSTPLIVSAASSSSGAATVSTVSGSSPAQSQPAQSQPAQPQTVPASGAPGSAPIKIIWPVSSRLISTVFSPAHPAVDIDEGNEIGAPVVAAAAGTVTFAGGDPCCSYGLYVTIDHGGGLTTLYAHFSQVGVTKGQVVVQGQQIGNSGCTGLCTGPHVHFEVHVNNHPIDPLDVLPPPWKLE